MSCYYQYEGKIDNFEGGTYNSIEELRDAIFSQVKNVQLLFGDFQFYHVGSKDEVRASFINAMEEHQKNKDKGIAVTKVAVSLSYGDSINKPSENLTSSVMTPAQFVIDFRKDFGTGVHAYYEDETVGIDDAVKTIHKYAELYRSMSKEDRDNTDKYYGKIIEFIREFDAKPDEIRIQLNKIKKLIEDHYSGYTPLLVEGTIQSKEAGGLQPLIGKPDLVLINDNGDIVIIDYKTSSSSITSKSTQLYRILQLEAYKSILETHGVDPSKIRYENVIIHYDKAGLNLSDSSFDDNSSADAKTLSEAKRIVRTYIPKKITATATASHDMEIAQQMQSKFNSNMLRKADELEYTKQAIDSAANNKQSKYSFKEGKYVYLSKEGNMIIGKDKEEKELFRKDLDTYANEEYQAQIERSQGLLEILIESLSGIDKNFNKIKSFVGTDEKQQRQFWSFFYKYMSSDYLYQPCPELEQFGIIVMKRESDDSYDFIQTTTAPNLDYSRNVNKHIFDALVKDKSLLTNTKEASELFPSQLKNIYKMNAWLAITQWVNSREDSDKIIINNVRVVSLTTGVSSEMDSDVDQIESAFKVLNYLAEKDSNNDIKIFKGIEDKFKKMKIHNAETQLTNQIVDSLEFLAIETADPEFANFDFTLDLEGRLEQLEKVQKYIETKYSSQANDRNSSIGKIYELTKYLQNNLKDYIGSYAYEINNLGISFNETIVNGWNLLANSRTANYTRKGLMITGLAQGLEMSTSYASPSNAVQNFQRLYDAYTAQMLRQLQPEIAEINDATKKFFEWGKSSGEAVPGAAIFGYHDNLYKKLFVHTDGKLSRDMMFLNPYSTSSGLIQEQKDFLEIVLWSINRHRMRGLDPKALELSYKDLKNSTYFSKYVEILNTNEDKYLQYPLRLASGASTAIKGFNSVVNGERSVQDYVKKEFEKIRQVIDPNIIHEGYDEAVERNIKKRKYVNPYKEGEKTRHEKTENHLANDWDLNIGKIVIDYALADVSEFYFGKLLNIVDKQVASIQLLEDISGKDFSKQIDALNNRVKISIYRQTCINKENKDLASTVGFIKELQAVTKIAIRPALMAKELGLGLVRNYQAIISKQFVNDTNITVKDLTEATATILGPETIGDGIQKVFGEKTRGEFSLVGLLNNEYAVSDRDLSIYAENVAYDRKGIYQLGSRSLYLNVTKPDWIHRMTLFVAKMKADGTFKAHSLGPQGELVYDMSKDERVNYFWNNRNNKALHNTEQFKKAEAFYKLRMQQFVAEGWKNPDGSALVYGGSDYSKYSAFPRCYTAREQDSIKEQIGMIYGYYSHEERAIAQKKLWWHMHTIFSTYLPGEIKKYFAVGAKSSIYKTIHEKDGITGKELYWEYDEETGMTTKTENKINKKGEINQPVLVDINVPYVGLVTQTVKTLGQVFKRDFKGIIDDKEGLNKLILFFFNLLLGILGAKLIVEASGAKNDNPSTGALVTADVIGKMGNELNFFQSVIAPIGDMGFVGTDFIQKTFKDGMRNISIEDGSLYDFVKSTFPLVKELHLDV